MKSLRTHRVYSKEPGRTIEGDSAVIPDVLVVGLHKLPTPLREYNALFDTLRSRRKLKPLIGGTSPLLPLGAQQTQRRPSMGVAPLQPHNTPAHDLTQEGSAEESSDDSDDNDVPESSDSDGSASESEDSDGLEDDLDEDEGVWRPGSMSSSDHDKAVFSLQDFEDVALDMY